MKIFVIAIIAIFIICGSVFAANVYFGPRSGQDGYWGPANDDEMLKDAFELFKKELRKDSGERLAVVLVTTNSLTYIENKNAGLSYCEFTDWTGKNVYASSKVQWQNRINKYKEANGIK